MCRLWRGAGCGAADVGRWHIHNVFHRRDFVWWSCRWPVVDPVAKDGMHPAQFSPDATHSITYSYHPVRCSSWRPPGPRALRCNCITCSYSLNRPLAASHLNSRRVGRHASRLRIAVAQLPRQLRGMGRSYMHVDGRRARTQATRCELQGLTKQPVRNHANPEGNGPKRSEERGRRGRLRQPQTKQHHAARSVLHAVV